MSQINSLKFCHIYPIGAEMGATRAGGLKSMYSDEFFCLTSPVILLWARKRYDPEYSLKYDTIHCYGPSLTCFCFAACFLQFECHHKPHQA